MEGLDLGFIYKPHCFSVYSDALDTAINILVADNIVHAERKGNSFFMDVDSSYIIESGLGKEAEEKINRTISKYRVKTPSETCLLTVAHYVGRKMTGRDLQDRIREVQKIAGAKYNENAIMDAINELDSSAFEG